MGGMITQWNRPAGATIEPAKQPSRNGRSGNSVAQMSVDDTESYLDALEEFMLAAASVKRFAFIINGQPAFAISPQAVLTGEMTSFSVLKKMGSKGFLCFRDGMTLPM